MNLQLSLTQKLLESLGNNHLDNWDNFRFGDEKQKSSTKLFPRKLDILNSRGYFHYLQTNEVFKYADSILGDFWSNLEKTYQLLEDKISQEIYVELLAYRILGHTKVKLSSNNEDRKLKLKKLHKQIDHNDKIKSNFKGYDLFKHKFNYQNKNLEIYLPECGPLYAFFLGEYRLPPLIETKVGDVVIDCGACWGDTTIEFASSVGEEGKVYTYEFLPFNLNILQKNISLNEYLSNRIKIVNKAVWDESEKTLFYKDDGPGTRVDSSEFQGHEGAVKTLSIDDLVAKENITKVSLIKMDIEGAEQNALLGAIETIKRFKPNLAISIYHNLNDYSEIAQWIEDIKLEYEFYVKHFTIHLEETVLFASVKN
jgi:FkbM family methyltransferase